MKKITLPISVLLLIIVVLLTASCRQVNIKSSKPISIPDSLTTQDAKLAIFNAVIPQSTLIKTKPYEEITDSFLSSEVKDHYPAWYREVRPGWRWFIEDIGPKSITLGFDTTKHYFRVEYIINQSEIVHRIVDSRNLNQTDTTIHRNVFTWMGNMDSWIRQSLGNIKVWKQSNPNKN